MSKSSLRVPSVHLVDDAGRDFGWVASSEAGVTVVIYNEGEITGEQAFTLLRALEIVLGVGTVE